MADEVTRQVLERAARALNQPPPLSQFAGPAPVNPMANIGNQSAGLTRGLLYGGMGAPVDIANMVMLGAGGDTPVGGSAWLEQKIDPYLSRVIGPQNEGQSLARLAGDIVAPGPGEFAAGSKLFATMLQDPTVAQKLVGGLLGMTAYHGSPHKFDKFELSDKTIGTGEGAQAYGHGLYFAEDPKVAGSYKSAFAKDKYLTVTKGGKDIYGDALTDKHLAAIKYLEEGAKDAGEFKHNTAYYAKKKTQDPEVLALIDEFKDAKIGYKSHASLYSVDIPDESIAAMLDWDAPLSEQPESVRKALRPSAMGLQEVNYKGVRGFADPETSKPVGPMFRNVPDGMDLEEKWVGEMMRGTGADFYKRLTSLDNQQMASKVLRGAGIPGIRYLDGASRGTGEGTRNFVVFDDGILKIINRE